MQVRSVVPILRSFDEAKAREFYVDFLGCAIDWQHRFDPDAPLYMQVSRGGLVLHLSEHHGDATPGSHIRVEVEDVARLHADLIGKAYRHNRPGLERPEWGGQEVTVTDPAQNRITFFSRDQTA
jgi:catechol 2,3-dioxygenase-like lactoylglutathione lyase family enzyme